MLEVGSVARGPGRGGGGSQRVTAVWDEAGRVDSLAMAATCTELEAAKESWAVTRFPPTRSGSPVWKKPRSGLRR